MIPHFVTAPLILNGDPGRIRTCDPLIRSQILYPAELRSHIVLLTNENYFIIYNKQSQPLFSIIL